MFSTTISARFFTVVLDQGVQHDTTGSHEALTWLKQSLEDIFPHDVRIVLSRTSQETIDPLQSASFSNCINADLHIVLNVFIEIESAKTIRIYTCSTQNSENIHQQKNELLTFTPAHRVHEKHAQTSKKIASLFFNTAKNNGVIPVFKPIALPLKPLQAVIAPSFLVEIGISKQKEWKVYFSQLFEGLKEVIMIASKNVHE